MRDTDLFHILIYIFFSIFILANIPKVRPIRIDRKRRLIYFSYFGKFYIYRYPKGEIGSSYLPFYNKTIERSIKTAAYYFPMLYVNIPNKDKNSKELKRVRLGGEKLDTSSDTVECSHYIFN